MKLRDKIEPRDCFYLPSVHSVNDPVSITSDVVVGWIERFVYRNQSMPIQTQKLLVLACIGDRHHIGVDQEQARALAKVLQHYADTGEVNKQ